MSTVRERVVRLVQPTPVPKLGGAVIAPDVPTWQLMVRMTQTPVFAVAVIVGLIFAAFGAAASPTVADKVTPHPAYGLTPRSPAITPPKLTSGNYPPPPAGDTQIGNPEELGPNPAPKNHYEPPVANPDLKARQDVPDHEPPPQNNPDLEAALNELDQNADRDRAWASQHPTLPVPALDLPQ